MLKLVVYLPGSPFLCPALFETNSVFGGDNEGVFRGVFFGALVSRILGFLLYYYSPTHRSSNGFCFHYTDQYGSYYLNMVCYLLFGKEDWSLSKDTLFWKTVFLFSSDVLKQGTECFPKREQGKKEQWADVPFLLDRTRINNHVLSSVFTARRCGGVGKMPLPRIDSVSD